VAGLDGGTKFVAGLPPHIDHLLQAFVLLNGENTVLPVLVSPRDLALGHAHPAKDLVHCAGVGGVKATQAG
jgi:hypothetical protein